MNERIVILRKLLNLSQKDFAIKVGLTQSAISAIELNKCGVTASLIITICNVFSVNEEWIINGKGEVFNNSSKLTSQFLDVMENLEPIFQSYILNCANQLLDIQNKLNLSKEDD